MTAEKTIIIKNNKTMIIKNPKGIVYILFILQSLKVEYVTELKFSKHRKFRFDIAIPKDKIAIEYEGIFSQKSRHTSIKGYTMDTEKYNLATIEGWKVLRYTAQNFKNFENDFKQLRIKKCEAFTNSDKNK